MVNPKLVASLAAILFGVSVVAGCDQAPPDQQSAVPSQEEGTMDQSGATTQDQGTMTEQSEDSSNQN